MSSKLRRTSILLSVQFLPGGTPSMFPKRTRSIRSHKRDSSSRKMAGSEQFRRSRHLESIDLPPPAGSSPRKPRAPPGRRTVEHACFLRKNRAFAHGRLDLVISMKQGDMLSTRQHPPRRIDPRIESLRHPGKRPNAASTSSGRRARGNKRHPARDHSV